MHPRSRLRLRLQDQLRRWQVDRFRTHLRHHGLCQDVCAQVQVGPTGHDQEGGQAVAKAEEGKEEQDEEGQGHQEGQGRSRRQEGKKIISFGSCLTGDLSAEVSIAVPEA